jgi:putative transcriptional regulator
MELVTIRNHLSREMGARRMSIKALAERAGLAYGTVFALYHDQASRIEFETLDKLCRALDCKVEDLLEYAPAEPPADA